jgi:hypothetical protein
LSADSCSRPGSRTNCEPPRRMEGWAASCVTGGRPAEAESTSSGHAGAAPPDASWNDRPEGPAWRRPAGRRDTNQSSQPRAREHGCRLSSSQSVGFASARGGRVLS